MQAPQASAERRVTTSPIVIRAECRVLSAFGRGDRSPRRAASSPGRVPNPDSGGSISGEDGDDGIPHGESLMTAVLHPSVDERGARGRAAREQVPRSVHTGWAPAPDRPDPVALLEEQNTTREPDLVPVRHGRMLVSPFTFYRGAAKIMATDLEDTPTAGLDVQLCGDAHLSNFGAFASPERCCSTSTTSTKRSPDRSSTT